MLKLIAEMEQGRLYGFGLTEANLNRLEFNREPIFFDFGYADHPELFGLIFYMDEFGEAIDIAQNLDAVKRYSARFLDPDRGVTPGRLFVFPFARNVMQMFRERPFWAFDTKIQITQPSDIQMFFAGRDEQDIEKYFKDAGFIDAATKRTYRGFGRRS